MALNRRQLYVAAFEALAALPDGATRVQRRVAVVAALKAARDRDAGRESVRANPGRVETLTARLQEVLDELGELPPEA